MDKTKIVFLVSGGGGTLRFLHYAIEELRLPFEITGVIADRDCEAFQFGKAKGALSKIIDYSRKRDSALNEMLADLNPDCVVTNIHRILSVGTLTSCPAFFVNLHYSLLPAYAGYIGMDRILREARAQNIGFLGATCHEVSDKLDGGRILCQGVVSVDWAIRDVWIKEKLFRTACFVLLNSLCMKFCGRKAPETSTFCDMNPPLVFDVGFATPSFWHRVKRK